MQDQEIIPATIAEIRAESARDNRLTLESILQRMPYRYDSMGMCFETSMRLIRVARNSASVDGINEDDGAAIAEALTLAEDIVNIAYLRYLLRDEKE